MTERQKRFLLSTRVSNCTPGWTFRTIDIKGNYDNNFAGVYGACGLFQSLSVFLCSILLHVLVYRSFFNISISVIPSYQHQKYIYVNTFLVANVFLFLASGIEQRCITMMGGGGGGGVYFWKL